LKHPLTNKANKYARDCVSGKVNVCLQVIQACQRHLDDMERKDFPFEFDMDKCERFLRFGELMPHSKGDLSGKTLKWEPWQCFCFGVPFGWVRKDNGLRRFNEMFLLIPRKNGKSFGAAVVGNYMFSADGEKGAEVYSAAGSEKQADFVFAPAWKMAKQTPAYKNRFNITLMGTPENPGKMCSLSDGSFFERVIGNPGDGGNPHCWIQDEYHESKTKDSYDTGKTGMGSRKQPMLLSVTTAGTNTKVPCFDLQKRVEKILSGDLVNEELFAVIYTIDKDDKWENFETWKKANPNLGVSVLEPYLRSQLHTALQSPRDQNSVKCKHLNVWSNAGQAWMNMVEWGKCEENLNINDFKGLPVSLGLDLASKIDIASKMYLFKKIIDAKSHYYLFSRHWIPEERTFDEEYAHYAGWVHTGFLTATPGARIDIHEIQETIKQDAKDFDLSGSENGGGEVCNDPWNAQQLITNLLNVGVQCVEIPQNVSFLSEPMKEIEACIRDGSFHHDGNPVTTWMMANVCCRVDKKDNIFPFKEGDENKIDGAVATITAMARAMYDEGIKSTPVPTFV